MAELLQIPNYPSANISEHAVLNADAATGQADATFLDIQGLTSGDKLVIDPGFETGELVTIQSINSSTKVVTFTANLANKHLRNATIYKLTGDNIRLYRADNVDGSIPDDNDFSLISTTGITAYNTFTQVYDPTGGSDYWYKSTYYNSGTADETVLNLSYATRGGGYGHYAAVDDIRLEAGMAGATQIDDSVFSARRDQAEAEVNGKLAAAGYTIPLQTSSGTSYTPPLLENIVRLLAAGYVLNQEYGPTTEGDTKNGDNKIKDAMRLLDDIQSSKIVLLDTTGAQLGRTSQVSGWPDDTTALVGTDGIPEPFAIRMSTKF